MTQQELEDQIAVLLGGRAAEEIEYSGVVSTGAADDLERASALVRQMVTRFGMSDRTAEAIDNESRRILDGIYARVKDILLRRSTEMTRISQALVRKETLERAELDQLISSSEPIPA
jgi:cell division protease FtsH